MEIGKCNTNLRLDSASIQVIYRNVVIFSCVYGEDAKVAFGIQYPVMTFEEAWRITGERLRIIQQHTGDGM